MTKKVKKVLFLPFAKQEGMNPFSASSRLRAQWVVKYWNEADYWDGEIDPFSYETIIFQKFYQMPYQREMARKLKEAGKRIILDNCDAEWVVSGDRDRALLEMSKIVDFTVCSTWWLTNATILRYPTVAYFIPDRQDLEFFPRVKKHKPTKNPIIVWYGNQNTLAYLNKKKHILEELGKNYPNLIVKVIMEKGFNFTLENVAVEMYEWNINTVNDEILDGDVVFNPHGTDEISLAKSDNKTTNAWALGLPVVSNGSDKVMVEHFKRLLDNHKLRQEIGKKARAVVEKFYDVRTSVTQWKELLEGNNRENIRNV
jgi:hypothetical protein